MSKLSHGAIVRSVEYLRVGRIREELSLVETVRVKLLDVGEDGVAVEEEVGVVGVLEEHC